MDADVQRPASNPTAMVAALVSKREKLQEELRKLEDQLYELEGNYLHDSAQSGNVLKGFEGFLSSSKSTTNLKRPRKLQADDRLFSLSSVTSPVEWNSGSDTTVGVSDPATSLEAVLLQSFTQQQHSRETEKKKEENERKVCVQGLLLRVSRFQRIHA